MTYVMSDLHGQFEKYRKMLEKIRFSDDDDLYILGDEVDRGPQSAELLLDMSLRPNVCPILGNHDLTARILLKKVCAPLEDDVLAEIEKPDTLKMLVAWQLDGGQATIDSFRKLPPDEREALIDYLGEFLPYDLIEVNDRQFLLVHGGIPYGRRKTPLKKLDTAQLILERPDYTKQYYKSTYLVTGHTPTVSISSEYEGKIYRKNGHIAVDCGAGFGLPLGCIRLEDFAEFYVE